jgi:murein L,D-transpeptidase YafK
VIKTYKVALGGDPIGAKAQQGDHKTPEAIYVLDSRNPHSQFYKSIHISYPNASDRAAARQKGVSAGGDVFVPGLPNGYGWVGASHRQTGRTEVSPSQTKRSTKSGERCRVGHPLKSDPRSGF